LETAAESALLVLIPEIEDLVAGYRRLYDSSAIMGVPAHITVLYPFKPPSELTPNVMATLQELFATFPAFITLLGELRRFPDVLYLAPKPDGPFRNLTRLITSRFKETPPYAGKFAENVPHLTIAQTSDQESLNEIAADFRQASSGRLPVKAAVSKVTLMVNESGDWRIRTQFPLRATPDIGRHP
jgi:2'-5' RNA ligase